MKIITYSLSEPGDEKRGIRVSMIALRWDGKHLNSKEMTKRAVKAQQIVDHKYDKDVWDVKILEVSEERQYVQLSVRANYSSDEEIEQIRRDFKREFGETVDLTTLRKLCLWLGIIHLIPILYGFLMMIISQLWEDPPVFFGILAFLLGLLYLVAFPAVIIFVFKLAKRLNRSAPIWASASLLAPFVLPIIISFLDQD